MRVDYWGAKGYVPPPLSNYWGGRGLAPLFLRLCSDVQKNMIKAEYSNQRLAYDKNALAEEE